MSKQVQAVPAGMHTVTPHLVCDGAAAAIEFYERAFGATDAVRLPGPDGRIMHAQIRIGDSAVMLVDENRACGMLGPKAVGGSPVTLHLYVDDVDTVYQRAVAAGAKATMPPSDMFWGDRYGVLEDPFGHHWSVATQQRDVSEEELQQAMRDMAAQSGS
jgi:PhnB protein